MISLCLTPGILMARKGWRVSEKIIATVWLAIIDTVIFAFAGIL
jgi:hypothetical protein